MVRGSLFIGLYQGTKLTIVKAEERTIIRWDTPWVWFWVCFSIGFLGKESLHFKKKKSECEFLEIEMG